MSLHMTTRDVRSEQKQMKVRPQTQWFGCFDGKSQRSCSDDDACQLFGKAISKTNDKTQNMVQRRIMKRATAVPCSTDIPVPQTCCRSDRGCTKLTAAQLFSIHISDEIKIRKRKNKKEKKLDTRYLFQYGVVCKLYGASDNCNNYVGCRCMQ